MQIGSQTILINFYAVTILEQSAHLPKFYLIVRHEIQPKQHITYEITKYEVDPTLHKFYFISNHEIYLPLQWLQILKAKMLNKIRF